MEYGSMSLLKCMLKGILMPQQNLTPKIPWDQKLVVCCLSSVWEEN